MLFRYKGIIFGSNKGDLIVTDLSAPTTEVRQEFTDNLGRDGARSSKSYLGKTSWQMTVMTNRDNLKEALASAERLESAWKDPAVRSTTALVPLDYSNDEGAKWFRIYGRPGLFAGAIPDVHTKLGVATLDLEFEQLDPGTYSADENMTTIYTSVASVGGIRTPIITPVTTVSTGEPRSGYVVNSGDLPAPLSVTFHGPSSNPEIRTNGKTVVQYKGSIPYDQTVTVDPQLGSVELSNGTSVAGRLGRQTRLSRLTVPSGQSTWTYVATDPTGSSKAELRWRDSHLSMQA